MQQSEGGNADLKLNTVAILAAGYFQNNHVGIAEIPNVMSILTAEVEKLMNPATTLAPVEEKREPAVAIKKSVTPDFIIDLYTGRKFKSLKRHLRTTHNMTPDQYRAYWGLPRDYPMTAPNYAAKRSELAKSIGLGRAGGPGRKAAAVTGAASAPKAAKTKAPAKARAPKATPAPEAPAAETTTEA